jgi:hypothetical protein
LHNKPEVCGASGAYAPGPDYEDEEDMTPHDKFCFGFIKKIYNFIEHSII